MLEHIRPEQPIIAGCTIAFEASDLEAGKLARLDVKLDATGLQFPERILPPVNAGKFSLTNRLGEEIVRRDLPLETHYHTVDTPNWGDESNGTHPVDLPYDAYPREFVAPRNVEVRITCPNPTAGQARYVMIFQLTEVLDRQSPEFEARLLFGLNILQENVGRHGVMPANSSAADYLASLQVGWEILPPGTLEEVVARIFGNHAPSNEEHATVEDRYKFLVGLKPVNFVYGTSGFDRYFGAQFSDDLVVFENVVYGNAIYLMFRDWQQLSKRSRVDLLSGRFGKDFIRVVHSKGWKGTVRSILKDRLGRTQ